MKKDIVYLSFRGRTSTDSLKSKFRHLNNMDIDESAHISSLNNISSELAHEIISHINYDLEFNGDPFINVKADKASIYFSEGSIEWEGIISILKWGAIISGNIALFQFLIPRIKNSINFVLKSTIFKNRAQLQTEVTPMNSEIISNSTNVFLKLPIAHALIILTTINLIVFFGGTILGGIQINSVHEMLGESRTKLTKASAVLSNKELEISNLTTRIKSKVKLLETVAASNATKLNIINNSITNLTNEHSKLYTLTAMQKKRLESFRKAKAPLNLEDMWSLSSSPVRALICLSLIFLCLNLSLSTILLFKFRSRSK